eukprot:scaffold90056_cov29-Tisochrysis_lutea.AAC.1
MEAECYFCCAIYLQPVETGVDSFGIMEGQSTKFILSSAMAGGASCPPLPSEGPSLTAPQICILA